MPAPSRPLARARESAAQNFRDRKLIEPATCPAWQRASGIHAGFLGSRLGVLFRRTVVSATPRSLARIFGSRIALVVSVPKPWVDHLSSTSSGARGSARSPFPAAGCPSLECIGIFRLLANVQKPDAVDATKSALQNDCRRDHPLGPLLVQIGPNLYAGAVHIRRPSRHLRRGARPSPPFRNSWRSLRTGRARTLEIDVMRPASMPRLVRSTCTLSGMRPASRLPRPAPA